MLASGANHATPISTERVPSPNGRSLLVARESDPQCCRPYRAWSGSSSHCGRNFLCSVGGRLFQSPRDCNVPASPSQHCVDSRNARMTASEDVSC
ncbi:hypothetical protein COCON_G00217400 [Conger conger]|uniref:Uncharacterized protein n=1 Tax=Conger conger TaxID=82655 RepID=A0A9Q1CY44_CONCO|nr:hypothetical protein COCON_G00217400 [Conger conger]